jgi:hypothetical protein
MKEAAAVNMLLTACFLHLRKSVVVNRRYHSFTPWRGGLGWSMSVMAIFRELRRCQ